MFGWGGNKGPSPAQKQIGEVLFNDALHVLSSFELNRIASLTYGDEVCEDIFEILEQVQARPMEHSILTVQKSLVITKHIMIYGSEKCVNSSMGLQRGVEALLEFNTVLWAQKLQGAAAMMYRLKGGGVDKGFVVREAAKEVWPLMTDVNKLRGLRNSSADPNSLVPIGNDKVAFLSDDVRHYMLKKRIQEQYKLQTKSNLVKAEGGFGSGYASKDGKSVVGAAHGLEEMMKQAEIANKKFSDEGDMGQYDIPDLKEIMAIPRAGQAPQSATTNAAFDLLGGGGGANPQQGAGAVGDLLDFSAGPTQPQAASTSFEGDLLGTGTTTSSGSADLLGTASLGGTSDLLGTGASAPASENISILLDPTAAASQPSSSTGLLDFGSATSQTPASTGLLDFGSTPTPAGQPPLSNGLLDFASDPATAAATATKPDASTGIADPMALLSLSEPATDKPVGLTMGDAPKTNMMSGSVMGGGSIMGGSVMNSSNGDRFAALDSLEVPAAAKNASTILSAKEAENRLLGQTSSFEMPSNANATNPAKAVKSVSFDQSVSETESATIGLNPSSDGLMGASTSTPMHGAGHPIMPASMPPVAPPDGLPDPGIAMPSSLPPVAPPDGLGGMGPSDIGLTTMPVQDMGMMSSDPSQFPMSPTSGSGIKVASLNVSAPYGGGMGISGDDGDDEDGFVMGGSMGSGLIPTAAAPAAPPPPPPPPM